jgi:hypothetical protein
MPEHLENLAWRNIVLKRRLFHVELNVLSILRFVWLSKLAVNDSNFKGFVEELIRFFLWFFTLSR